MKKKTSIRTQLMSYLAIVAILCAIVVFFSNATVSENLNASKLFFDCNKNLSDFYANVTEMDTFARGYLYERTSDNFKQYSDLLEKSKVNLSNIEKNVDESTQWRMSLLRNMLDYYCAPMDNFISGSTNSYSAYNMLLYRRNLILDTSTTYYGHLAQYMKIKTDTMQTEWERQRNLQAVVLAAFVCFAIAMGSIYSKGIYSPIAAMVKNTELLKKGSYKLEPIDSSLTEIDILASSFLKMASSLERNVDMLKKNAKLEYQLLKQENDNLEMRNLVTESELHALQAQINPHFLFNTLSMISKSAYISGDNTTSALMDNLSEFLRYALDKANKNSTLFEEIDSIKSYLFIQQKRFSGRVSFEVEVDKTTPNVHMPAIILQPLVENAITHGTSSMTQEAIITIHVYEKNSNIHIHIEDNGVGMKSEDLESLLSKLKMGLESSSGDKGRGIGLSNVYRRLQVYFGSSMQFYIESEEDCGTVVTLIFPTEENFQ
ncbi:MAG: sensor histidine kinase [Oscillospiraceae bacterium]